MAVISNDKEVYAKKVKHIKVIPLNMEAINADIDKWVKLETKKAGDSSFAPNINPNEYFGLRGTYGIIKGTNVLIDDECVGECVKDKVALYIYGETRDENGKVEAFDMFPRFTTKQTLADLQNKFGMGEVSLQEFMADRFAYNGRIMANINEIVAEYKKQVK